VSNWEVALIAALLSGGFAIAGVLASDWLARRREDRQFRTTTALELAETELHVWGDSWIDLTVQLERQETQLAIAQTPEELIKALREISEMCWYDQRQTLEQTGESAISTTLLDARRAVNRAIAAQLLRSGSEDSRNQLQDAAVSIVRGIAADPAKQHLRSRRAQEEDEAPG
jgi:hypothetical protein